jgi:hypothetical protein
MSTRGLNRLARAGVAGALLAGFAPHGAADPGTASEVGQLKAMLAEHMRLLEQQRAELARQQRELDELRADLRAFARREQPVQTRELATTRAAGSSVQLAQAPAAPLGRAPEAETKPPAVAPITDAVTVLTPPGRFVYEPSLQYAHSSSSRVALTGFTIIPALTIGLIDIRSVSRNMWTVAMTGRYGVTDRLEVEAKLPAVYRKDSTLARPLATPSVSETAFDVSGDGIGDVEIATRYQMSQRPPFYIGYLRFKTRTGKGPFEVGTSTPATGLTVESELPTGTGFYSLQPGITALIPSDPAVFFGGVSYIWNIKRNIDTLDSGGTPIGKFDPGDGISVNFGMGLSINERASFSLGYDHSTYRKDKRNGEVVPNAQTQQVGSLLFGLAYRVNPRTNFNLTLGVGATQAAPDVQVTLRLPISF